jgi:hypothetical protein
MFPRIAYLPGINVHNLKLKVNVKFALEQDMKFSRWSRSIDLFFFNLGAVWGE